MTDMTPEEINQRIAEWAGWTNVKQSRMYQGRLMGNMPERYEMMVIPDYYRSNAAMDLLVVLVERGYYPCLFFDITRKVWRTSITQIERGMWFAEGSTIPAAICTAIIELIEREGR